MRHYLLAIGLNFSAFMLLVLLIAAPIYFAKNITKIAGVKTESPYLLISQTEKFPGMSLVQTQNVYTITFTKQAQNQAFLAVFIINNPTTETKSYTIQNDSSTNTVFFGENLNDPQTSLTLPPQSSSPISILSESNISQGEAMFLIYAKND